MGGNILERAEGGRRLEIVTARRFGEWDDTGAAIPRRAGLIECNVTIRRTGRKQKEVDAARVGDALVICRRIVRVGEPDLRIPGHVALGEGVTGPRLAGRRDVLVHHHEHYVTHIALVARDLLVDRARRAASRAAEQEALAQPSRVLETLQQLLGEIVSDRGRRRENAKRRQASGFFHRSIGLTTPLGWNGISTLRPSPAEAYAAYSTS